MSRRFPFLLTLLPGLLCPPLFGQGAGERFRPERHFPAGAVLYVHIPGVSSLVDGFLETPPGRMIAHPGTRRALGQVPRMVKEFIRSRSQEFVEVTGMSVLDVLGLFRGEVALALYLPGEGGPPGVALALELGEQRAAILGLLEKLDAFARETGATLGQVEVGAIRATGWPVATGAPEVDHIFHAVLDSHVVLTYGRLGGEDLIRPVASAFSGREVAVKSLGDQSLLRQLDGRLEVSRRAVFLAADTARIGARIRRFLLAGGADEETLAMVLRLLGLGRIEAAGMALGFHDGLMEGRLRLELGEETRGILTRLCQAISPVVGVESALRRTPRGASSISVSAIAPGELLRGIIGDLRELIPEARETINGFLETLERKTGISVERDLFSVGKMEIFQFSHDPPAGGLLQDAFALVRTAQFEPCRKVLERLIPREGDRLVQEFGGKKVHSVRLLGLLASFEEIPTPPVDLLPALSWAEIDGEWTALSFSRFAIRRYVENYARGEPATSDAALLALARARLDGSIGTIQRGGRGLISLYNSVVSLANYVAAPLDGVLSPLGVDLGLLPPGEEFLDGIRDGVFRLEISPQAIDLHGDGLLSGVSNDALLLVGGASLVAALLVPVSTRTTVETGPVHCMNNLREIFVRRQLYAAEKGDVPAGTGLAPLQALVDATADTDPELFVCLDSPQEPALPGADGKFRLTPGTCSYEAPPIGEQGDAQTILIHERAPHHGGRRCVLFADGSVRILGEPEFQEALRSSLERARQGR